MTDMRSTEYVKFILSVHAYPLTLAAHKAALMSHFKPLHILRYAMVGYLAHLGVGTHQRASCMLQRLSQHPASHATLIA
jgi:hypothetical protein